MEKNISSTVNTTWRHGSDWAKDLEKKFSDDARFAAFKNMTFTNMKGNFNGTWNSSLLKTVSFPSCDRFLRQATLSITNELRKQQSNVSDPDFPLFLNVTVAHLKSTNCSAIVHHGIKGDIKQWVRGWYGANACMVNKANFVMESIEISAGVAAVGLVGLLLALSFELIGFTSSGVTDGSVAAAWQSSLGDVEAGSLFAQLQSFAASGGFQKAGAVVFTFTVVLFVTLLFLQRFGCVGLGSMCVDCKSKTATKSSWWPWGQSRQLF